MSTQVYTNSVTLTDATEFDRFDTAAYCYLTSVSGTNTITATGPANMTLAAPQHPFVLVPAVTNTGATTLNITPSGGAALTAKNVFCNGVALVAGELKAGVPALLVYDGTQFQIIGPFVAGTIPGTLSVTGTSTLTGNVGIGGASSAAVALSISTATLTGVTQVGMQALYTGSSSATTATMGAYARPNTAAAAYTSDEVVGYYADGATKGAGSTINNHFGFHATANINQGGTLNAAFRGEVAAAATRYNLYMDGTAQNYLAGSLFVGTTGTQAVGGVNASHSFAGANGLFQASIYNAGANALGLGIRYATDNNGTANEFLYCEGNATLRASIRSNGGVANFSANDANLSDERVKTKIEPAKEYLAVMRAIPVKTFLYKDQTDKELNLGVIAQDVEKVAPELIDTSGFGKTPEGEEPYKAIYQTDFQYATLKALQELADEFDAYVKAHP